MKLVVDLPALRSLPHVVIADLRELVRYAERRGVLARSSYADFHQLLGALERADEARLTTEPDLTPTHTPLRADVHTEGKDTP